MKRFILALVLSAQASAWAWIGSGQNPDYSRDAGNMFYCASTATVNTQAGISVTSPTITLYNLPSSGKNLVLLDVGINIVSAPAAASDFMLAFSTSVAPSTTTSANYFGIVTPALVGKSTTTAIAQCWLVTNIPSLAVPKPFRYLGGTTGAAAISGFKLFDETNGKVVVPPGVVISVQATSAAAIQGHLLWREEPQ